MAGYKNIAKVALVFLIVGFAVAQVYENKRMDVEQFLENIRNMLKERMERVKRREDKKKVRKMLIKKFSTFPRIRRPEDYIIHIRKDGTGGKAEDFLKEEGQQQKPEIKSISPQTVNKVLRANPVFNLFSIDRLKKLLSQIKKQQNDNGWQSAGNNNSSSTPSIGDSTGYENELKAWFGEVYSKIQWFWDMVYRLFIVDEQRFEYLKGVLCREEITNSYKWSNSPVWGCPSYSFPERFRVINLSNPDNMPCKPLVPQNLRLYTRWLGKVVTCVENNWVGMAIKDHGQCTPSLYQKARFTGNKGQYNVKTTGGIHPTYNDSNSLCYNLVALNLFVLKNELYDVFSSNLKEKDKINYISSNAGKFTSYIQFMEKIFKKKIIPAMAEMCYVRCLCEDIGIGCTIQQRKLSNEEKIIIVLWNLQKNGYLSFTELLRKLIIFKHVLVNGGLIICDKMQNDFKKIIMGNIEEDIIEKRDKLIEMKEKIEQTESKGQIDTSVYRETMKLVEKIRKELIPLRKALVELWKNRIENTTSLNDLICVLDSFKRLVNDISINNKNVLELYLSDLLSGNGAKTKGLSRFINIVGGDDTLYVSFQSVQGIENLFSLVSAFDLSIYVLTTTFNTLKCVIDNVTIAEFLGYLVSQKKITLGDVGFLKCFMSGGKTIKQCAGGKYGVIETIIGDVTIDSLGDFKDRIEKLKWYNKWEDIPTIKDCCGDGCRNIHRNVVEWCEALTSPIFSECCQLPLNKCCDRTKSGCNPSSEPFCLIDDPVQCNSRYTSIAEIGSPCKSLSDKLVSLFSIYYNDYKSRIFCDVIKNYDNFCKDPVGFINNIKDNGVSVMVKAKYGELRCECLKCSLISQNVCKTSLSINYTKRNEMEEFLKRVGLLEEAKKAIEGGLSKNFGQCPFQ